MAIGWELVRRRRGTFRPRSSADKPHLAQVAVGRTSCPSLPRKAATEIPRHSLPFGRLPGWLPVGLVALTLVLLIGNSLPVAEAQSLVPSVELSAPRQIKLGAPMQIKLAVRDAADIAGYEANVEFDTSAVELNGVSQRHAGI